MDGTRIIDDLYGDGFMPEGNREQNFLDNLKARGFVFFDKSIGKFKMKDGVIKTENYDEIVLEMKPIFKSVGLYSLNNNFAPVLAVKILKPNVFVKLASGNSINSLGLGTLKLGVMVDATAVGYAENGKNEAFLIEVDPEIREKLGIKYPKSVMTTSLARGANAKDSKNLDFKGVRPTKIKLTLGAQTTMGDVFTEEDFNALGEKIVLDKARFFA